MNILVADDDDAQRAISAQRAHAEWPAARIIEAASADEARLAANVEPIDVLIIELALPERRGDSPSPRERRLTLDHREIDARFPGLIFAEELLRQQPSVRLRVHTILREDHSDVVAARHLGAELVSRKRRPVKVPLDTDASAGDRAIAENALVDRRFPKGAQ